MLLKSIFRKNICFLAVTFLLFGCTLSTTQTKKPMLATDLPTISSNVGKFVTCEHIDMQGTVKLTGKDSVSELTIKIINGKDIPTAQDQQEKLGKEIAQQFKRSLVDTNEYNNYKVLFVTAKSNGMVNESTYSGHIYKKEEL